MDAYVRPDALFSSVPALFRKAHYDDVVDVLFENARDQSLFWHLHGDTFYLRDVALSRIFLKARGRRPIAFLRRLSRRCVRKRSGGAQRRAARRAPSSRCSGAPEDQNTGVARAAVRLQGPVLALARRAGHGGRRGLHELRRRDLPQLHVPGGLHIDKNDWKTLKMTCGGRQKRCPEFRFCRDKYDLARQHFVHSNIDAGATRRFRYDVGGGWRADVVVADVIGGPRAAAAAVDKSDLLGTLGLLHVGADRVLGQLPPLEETPPLSGVSVRWAPLPPALPSW